MTTVTCIGGGWAAIGLVPLVGWPKTRHFGLWLACAVTTQASLVWFLKLVFGRVRPWLALGLPAPIGAPQDGSFPSGHAAGNFCVAVFLIVLLHAMRPTWTWGTKLCAALLVAVAALVALSRVYLGAHFPSDVLGGAALGAMIGASTARLYMTLG